DPELGAGSDLEDLDLDARDRDRCETLTVVPAFPPGGVSKLRAVPVYDLPLSPARAQYQVPVEPDLSNDPELVDLIAVEISKRRSINVPSARSRVRARLRCAIDHGITASE